MPERTVTVTIDDTEVTVPEGATLLDACRKLQIDTPTLCDGDTSSPPTRAGCAWSSSKRHGRSCRRARARPRTGWWSTLIRARSPEPPDGVRAAGLLGRPVDHADRAAVSRDLRRQARAVRAAGASGPDRERRRAGYHVVPDGQTAATVAGPVKVDNDLYVRDYSKSVLCYKCVDACGDQHQNTFAITVAGRGFDAHISTEYAVPLPESACVYCGNCIAVCPTGTLMASHEHDLRESGEWDPSRQSTTDTICAFCGVGCNLTLPRRTNGSSRSPHRPTTT